MALLLLVRFSGEALALLVSGQGVVLLEVAELRLGPAQRVRRHGRPVAAGIDAGLIRRHRSSIPVSCYRGSGHTRSAWPPSCRAPAWRLPTVPAHPRRVRAEGPARTRTPP